MKGDNAFFGGEVAWEVTSMLADLSLPQKGTV